MVLAPVLDLTTLFEVFFSSGAFCTPCGPTYGHSRNWGKEGGGAPPLPLAQAAGPLTFQYIPGSDSSPAPLRPALARTSVLFCHCAQVRGNHGSTRIGTGERLRIFPKICRGTLNSVGPGSCGGVGMRRCTGPLPPPLGCEGGPGGVPYVWERGRIEFQTFVWRTAIMGNPPPEGGGAKATEFVYPLTAVVPGLFEQP